MPELSHDPPPEITDDLRHGDISGDQAEHIDSTSLATPAATPLSPVAA